MFSKLFEKTIYNEVYSFLCKYKLINRKQFGFRGNRSTEHVLISLTDAIKQYLNKGFYSCEIFVIFKK